MSVMWFLVLALKTEHASCSLHNFEALALQNCKIQGVCRIPIRRICSPPIRRRVCSLPGPKTSVRVLSSPVQQDKTYDTPKDWIHALTYDNRCLGDAASCGCRQYHNDT